MPEFPAGPRSPEDGVAWGQQGGMAPPVPSSPVRQPGVNGALCASPLLTLPYFTAEFSCGNWNEDELQAAGKVLVHRGRAAERGAAVHPERYVRVGALQLGPGWHPPVFQAAEQGWGQRFVFLFCT